MNIENFKSPLKYSQFIDSYDKELVNSNHKILNKFSLKINTQYKPAIFFDRDGVIIKDTGHVSDPNDVELLPGIKKLLYSSKQLGWFNVVVTNQSGIARELFKWNDYENVTFKILELLGKNYFLDGIYANGNGPHHELLNDSWRKPNPNMIIEAASTFKIDLNNSIMIGDRFNDMLSGYRSGIKKFVHVLTGHGSKERNLILEKFSEEYVSNNLICINNLLEFPVNKILKKIF